MGGDLTQGIVTTHGIRCPVHSWEFGPGGQVVGNNRLGLYSCNKPCQKSIVCSEKHGIVFGYFGTEPSFDLPEPDENVMHSCVYVQESNFRYDIPSVFGFDSEHFETVHRRGLRSLEIYQNHKTHLGTRIHASVDGVRLGDRIMRRLGMNDVELDVDFWAANVLFGQHRHSNTYVILAGLPIDEHRTRMYVSIMQKQSGKNPLSKLLEQLRFSIAKPVTRAFIAQDEHAMEGIRFDRHSPHITENTSVHQWLAHYDGLPRLSSWLDNPT